MTSLNARAQIASQQAVLSEEFWLEHGKDIQCSRDAAARLAERLAERGQPATVAELRELARQIRAGGRE